MLILDEDTANFHYFFTKGSEYDPKVNTDVFRDPKMCIVSINIVVDKHIVKNWLFWIAPLLLPKILMMFFKLKRKDL